MKLVWLTIQQDFAVGHRPPQVPESLVWQIRELTEIMENTQSHAVEIANGISHGILGFMSQYEAGQMVYQNMRPAPDANDTLSHTNIGELDADVGPLNADVPPPEQDNN